MAFTQTLLAQPNWSDELENVDREFDKGNYNYVIATADRAMSQLAIKSDPFLYRQFLQFSAKAYFELPNYEEAIQRHIRYILHSERLNVRFGELAEGYYLLGKVYLKINAFGEADRCFTKSHDFFAQDGDQLGMAKSLQASALAAFNSKEFSRAQEIYTDLVALLNSNVSLPEIKGLIYEGLLKSCLNNKDYSTGLDFGKNYINAESAELGMNPDIPYYMSQLAIEAGSEKDAVNYAQLASEISPDDKLKYLNQLAKSYLNEGRISEADVLLTSQVIEEARGSQDYEQLVEAFNTLGKIGLETQDSEISLYYLQGAEQIARDRDMSALLFETYSHLIRFYTSADSSRKASFYRDNLVQLQQRIDKELSDFRLSINSANNLVSRMEMDIRNEFSNDSKVALSSTKIPSGQINAEAAGNVADNSNTQRLENLEQQQADELSRKERMIMQQQWELQKAQIQTAQEQQKLLIIIVSFSLLTIVILTVFVWRVTRSNKIISRKNTDLAKQQRELEEAQAQLKETLEVAKKTSDNLRVSNAELKSAQSQLIHAEKMSSLGQLTAGIVHEINNPVNFIRAGIETLDSTLSKTRKILAALQNLDVDNTDNVTTQKLFKKLGDELSLAYEIVPNILKDVLFGTSRINDIINSLRIFSRQDDEDPQDVSLHGIIDSALLILKTKYLPKAKIKKNYDSEIGEISCFPGQLNQVIVNIVSNAVDAIADRGVINITTINKGEQVAIEISDSGAGIPEEIQEHIFEPFYTTKDAGTGTGLGLSISYSIVEKHGGSIMVDSKQGIGTKFTILINKVIKHTPGQKNTKLISEDILN